MTIAPRPAAPPLPGYSEDPPPVEPKCVVLFCQTVERERDWSLEVAVLHRVGPPVLALRTRLDGLPKSRIEIRTSEELDALEAAIAVVRRGRR